MIGNLQIVLLSKLSEQPYTGYDLTKIIKQSPWQASHQQVYRELAKLERNIMVVCKEIPQQGKPDKKCYSITEKGCAALKDPELLQPAMKKMQDDASAMLFVGNPEYFQNLITESMHRATSLEILKLEVDPLRQLSISRELRLLMADIEWCQEVMKAFTQQQASKSLAA